MNDDNILGGVLNQLGQTVKQTAKQVVKMPEEMGQDLGSQVGGAKAQDGNKPQENKPEKQWQSDDERIQYLKDLYGKSDMSRDGTSDPSKNANPNPPAHSDLSASGSKTGGKQTEFEKQIADKSPEEQKKLLELRRQLHKQVYYDPTFNPVKNPPAGGEERPAEKVENEKKKEMMELQEKEEKKPQPLAVVRERNKAEMFRGAAG